MNAPTEAATYDKKDHFYNKLQVALDKLAKNDVNIVMGMPMPGLVLITQV